MVEVVSGAVVLFSDNAIATGIGEPIFLRGGNLINTSLVFFPILLVITMFRFIFDMGKGAINKSTLKSKKSLENK